MKLSREQLEVFTDAARKPFMDYMQRHLVKTYPRLCDKLGHEGVRQRIRSGIDKAAAYGIEGQRDVARFIDLMFVVGPDFDQEKKWNAILNDEYLDPPKRVDRVCGEVFSKE